MHLRHWSDGKGARLQLASKKSLQSGRREFESHLAHVTSVVLKMSATPERARFKRTFGQANHFLLTLIVGLEAVKAGNAGPTLPAAWNPINPVRSAQRSEGFAIQGTLVFLVTALDRYLGDVARLARSSSVRLAAAIDAAKENDKGLRGEIQAFADFAGGLRTVELALVESAVQWRNRIIHPSSKARFNNDLCDRLLEHAQELKDDYRHLDPEQMIARFESHVESPSFKEITGMITATHRFVRVVDSAVLATLDYESFIQSTIKRHLAEVPRDEAQKRANRIWGRTELRARRAIVSLARQNGFTDPEDDAAHGLTDTTIEQLAGMSCRQALTAFLPLPS